MDVRNRVSLFRNAATRLMVVAGLSAGLIAVSAPFAVPQGNGGNSRPAERARTLAPGDLDVGASRVYIFVPKSGLGHDHAVEGKLKSGRLELGAGQDAGEFTFDMPTFDADTASARRFLGLPGVTDAGTRREVNANMLGPSILNVRQFPTATFAISSAVPSRQPGRRGTTYELTGKFTLHGTTRALTVSAESEQVDGRTHLKGSFPLVQTHYGIQPFSKAFGAVGVANQLTVHADLWLAGEKSDSKGAAP